MTNFQSGKMDAAVVVLQGKRSILPPPPPPPPAASSSSSLLISKVSPSVFLIIIILAIIFFVSGLLHLLVRYLLRPQRRDPDEMDSLTVLQGQLQQLFHLHDAGVDQSFIDTLPIFSYKAIIGVKSPFDCAVCLSEFEADDKLRLLPKCSHAFHMDCIDTWLLSHSTCPLCRASLIPDFNSNRHCSPIVLVLESGSESSREIIPEREVGRVSSHLSFRDELRLPNSGILPKSCEIQIQAREDENQIQDMVNSGEKVLPVKLGKYRNQNPGESSSTTTNNIDSRRCFSMGSFAYIMDENSSLQVPVRTPLKKPSLKKPSLPLNPRHRAAMSECGGGDSRREEFVNFEAFRNNNSHLFNNAATIEENNNNNNKAIGNNIRGESFSISKIWLRGKRDNNPITEQPSRRAFSFRFPLITEEKGNNKGGRRTISEADVGRWANNSNGVGSDFDSQSICSLDSQANNPPSFARKTLLWLMGRQNKVVHSQFSSSNV